MSEPVTIQSTDYWIKVVEMLQQNWALIEAVKPEGVCVYFISDTSGVFDQMSFADEIAAREAFETREPSSVPSPDRISRLRSSMRRKWASRQTGSLPLRRESLAPFALREAAI